MIPKEMNQKEYLEQFPELNLVSNVENGLMRLSLKLLRLSSASAYQLESLQAVLYDSKEFLHGVYQGISTRILEEFLIHADTSYLKNNINKPGVPFNMYNDILLLWNSGNKWARETVAVLMLRHWTDTPMEAHLPSDLDRKQFERSLIVPVNGDDNDFNARELLNLLKGRAVLKFIDGKDVNSGFKWIRLEDGKLVEYPHFDINSELIKLPIIQKPTIVSGSRYLIELSQGNRLEEIFMISGLEVRGFIEVDPKDGRLKVTDSKGKEIYLNASQKHIPTLQREPVRCSKSKGKKPK